MNHASNSHSGTSRGPRPSIKRELPETIGNGKLYIDSQAEPLAAQPHFLLKLELEDVSLPALNEFAATSMSVRACSRATSR